MANETEVAEISVSPPARKGGSEGGRAPEDAYLHEREPGLADTGTELAGTRRPQSRLNVGLGKIVAHGVGV